MTSLFLDTGYIIALELADDQHHQQALAHWKNLTLSLPSLVTTSYVFDVSSYLLQQSQPS